MILEVNSLFKNVQAQSEVVYYTPVYRILYSAKYGCDGFRLMNSRFNTI